MRGVRCARQPQPPPWDLAGTDAAGRRHAEAGRRRPWPPPGFDHTVCPPLHGRKDYAVSIFFEGARSGEVASRLRPLPERGCRWGARDNAGPAFSCETAGWAAFPCPFGPAVPRAGVRFSESEGFGRPPLVPVRLGRPLRPRLTVHGHAPLAAPGGEGAVASPAHNARRSCAPKESRYCAPKESRYPQNSKQYLRRTAPRHLVLQVGFVRIPSTAPWPNRQIEEYREALRKEGGTDTTGRIWLVVLTDRANTLI